MKVTKKGGEDPDLAVVYCTHGDETAGKKAVERLLEEEPSFRKPVKFVFANQKAYREGERFIDTDLNRSFPGDAESSSYEERLAAELMEELKNVKVLDLHESSTSPTPFSLFTGLDKQTICSLRKTGVERAVEISYTPGCGINHYGGIEVETGPKNTEKSVKKSLEVLKQFLINNNALKGEKSISKPEMYAVYSTADKKTADFEVEAENFQKVESGEVYARTDEEDLSASESFVPVLFDENYPDIFGFKAVRLEKVEERILDKRQLK
jgi:succinylglutamate desuccinylase